MVQLPTSWTVEVPGSPDVPGETKPRRHYLEGDQPLQGCPAEAQSGYEVFLRGVKMSGDQPYLGHRPMNAGVAGPYVWETYNQVHARIKNLGSGFTKRGLVANDAVGLFSVNRPEWVIAEQASFTISAVTVPLYDTLGIEAIDYIMNQVEVKTVVATQDKAKILLGMKDKLPTLALLVLMDGSDAQFIAACKEKGVDAISITDLEKEGSENPVTGTLATKDTLATICYTSGTTGTPKGVMLSHENLMSFCAASQAGIAKSAVYNYTKNDVYISYLPLAHVFERAIQVCLTYVGARLGFYQGDTLKLLDDVAELKPTIFASVPRLFNRIYDKVMQGVKAKGGLAATLFNKAFAAKKAGLADGHITHFLWDSLVFGKVRARLGGRVRVMLTGAAPISADVMDFLRICFSAHVHEGYGQTETSAGAAVTDIRDISTGHIGAPCASGEIKLVDVPSMNYISLDKPHPRGEICVRGNNVFKGYYKAPEKTAEVLDKDGWCHTGDVGMWDAKGHLVIIDRVKNIFKLAQGEYIAPEKIEMVYQKHELVGQTFVYGDSLQACLVAIVVPDEDTFKRWAVQQGLPEKSIPELCADDATRKAVLKALAEFGKAEGLKGFENVKDVFLEPKPFTPDNGLMTPTFKLKRHEAKIKYQSQIDAMYAAVGNA
ncbi:Long chain acyl-CoA synthetase 7 peroxisomal [Geranomyces variabilis]|nr:Long chain acyl-CoA synthetase 7 peroxisomal [Geranomyces variabilis]